MKILQTFWSGPADKANQNLLSTKAGWLSCEYHWMSWALSCLQAKSVFGDVNLVTDEKGKQILIDQLELPYSTVSVSLEGTLDNYHPALFSLAKIHTYGTQAEPFLHLDGDVFLWQKPDADFMNSRLLAQNLDKNLEFYPYTLNQINQHFTFVPPVLQRQHYENKDVYGSNAGLIGGSDLDFFRWYSREAFDFIDKNKDNLNKVNTGSLNFIFEQYLFCQLAAENRIPVTYYRPMVDDPVFKDYIKFEDHPNVAMVHPVGNFKKYHHVCDHVARTLRSDYPDYYYRIIDLVRSEGLSMRSAIYYSPLLKLTELAQQNPGKAVESSFLRTNAAIDYLNKKDPQNQIAGLNSNAPPAEFIKNVKLRVSEASDCDCLLEIFGLESAANELLEKLYTDEATVTNLYKADRENYSNIRNVFSLPDDELLQIKIGLPIHYKLLNHSLNWKLDYKEQVHALIQRNFNTEKAVCPMLLLPSELEGGVKEYYLDELDMIVFDTVKDVFTIANLLIELKTHFSSEEIEEDYLSFKQLIISTIKGLLYAGVVEIKI
ncbi:DUF6734 family protein [Mucilaginibacter xinganensis]|uniref:DUF6734 domain-containing protein n=1 Tax=Mucilaginibacter xinganensis TaxID=1234841 RepID=A0A223P3C0_9SPHI|nr:DUF6734 family protein [Mucilaginibacter xinganensis]ASU36311.1 hypothetical protein MuYL_4426 [Mucilaginibacter xinganensis]